MKGLSTSLTVSRIRRWRYAARAWDTFAQDCGASFLCSSALIKLLVALGCATLLEFHLHAPDGSLLKIGQCAVATFGRWKVFLDGISLADGYAGFWLPCLELAVEKIGPGLYRYGSNWNIEAAFPVRLKDSWQPSMERDFFIEAIDFRRWPSFEAYLSDISENLRRNIAQVKKLEVPPQMEFYEGLAALRAMHHVSILRRISLAKHGVRINVPLDYLVRFTKVLVFRRYVRLALIRNGGTVYSAFYGLGFGRTLHYNTGATRPDAKGLGPYLFVEVIRRWFEHHPNGRLVMGWVRGQRPDEHTGGHLLFRRKLRVTLLEGGRIRFRVPPRRTDPAACDDGDQ